MIERRLVGRRFIDFHPETAHPAYPGELERRRGKRRAGDREGTPGGVDALMPGKRRRPPVLFSGILRCNICGRELRRVRNLSSEGRQHFIIEHSWISSDARCPCQSNDDEAHARIEWVLQAGTE